ncbi:MAG: ArsA family ATPase [Chloroflexota bacterium]
MRIILYLGKGGVGKTTMAAATAMRSAELGYKTLVVSTDIAHSLADSLDTELGNQPIEVAPNLFAQEINVLDELRDNWGKLQSYVGNVLRKEGMNKAIAEEMAIIPGMEEIVSLLHIHRQAKQNTYDRVIVDAAPTGETMRLLTMPESFSWYVERFMGGTMGISRVATGILRKFVPEAEALDGLANLVEGVKQLQKTLINPEITSYRIVVNPEKMVIKEGARALTYLSLYGYPVDAIMVNRILPGISLIRPSLSHDGSSGNSSSGFGSSTINSTDNPYGISGATLEIPSQDEYLQQLQKNQCRYLTQIGQDFFPLPLLSSEWSGREMVGVDALSHLAQSVFGDADPGQIFFVGQPQEITEQDDSFVLKLPLPNVELNKVQLTKRGDELFVRIGNFKRELLLPAALAQRAAGGAVLNNGVLHINFPPVEPKAA